MKYFSSFLLVVFFLSEVTFSQSFDSNVKLIEYDYENEIEQRLTEKLSKLVGKDNVFVNVNMTLTLKETVQKKGGKKGKTEVEVDYENSLPGFVSLKAKNNQQPSQVLVNHKINISGLIIDIFVNDILPDVVLQEADAVVKSQPFIADIQNVSVNVSRRSFVTTTSEETKVDFFAENWQLIFLAVLGLLGILFFIALLKISSGLGGLKNSISQISVGSSAPSSQPNFAQPKTDSIQKIVSSSTKEESKTISKVLPFDFLTNYSDEVISEIVKTESNERLGLILSLSGSLTRTKILGNVGSKRLAKILNHISEETSLSRNEISLVVENIQSKIENFLNPSKITSGGIDVIAQIVDENLQNPEVIFEELQTESESLGKALKEKVFHYDKILDFDENAVAELIKISDKKDIAHLLVANDKVSEKLKKSMNDRMKTTVKDYIDVIPKNDKQALLNAKNNIVQIAKVIVTG